MHTTYGENPPSFVPNLILQKSENSISNIYSVFLSASWSPLNLSKHSSITAADIIAAYFVSLTCFHFNNRIPRQQVYQAPLIHPNIIVCLFFLCDPPCKRRENQCFVTCNHLGS
jgi:hypothetical protein